MGTYSVKKAFKINFDNIFSNSKYKNIPDIKNDYHSIDEIAENSLLFIGLNPSKTGDESIDNKRFKNLLQRNNPLQRFFGKFEEISEGTSLKWSHLDLLVFRITNQKEIEKLANDENNHGREFLLEQLNISKKILESVKPKIIVVANTLSREFLGKGSVKNGLCLDYKFKFDDKLGTDRIINEDSNLFNTPVFFSSMLSGQRALDLGSFERLIWHIKFVNSKISK